MRVLSILPYPVLPLIHGGRVRTYRLAVGLARAGASVDLCCPWHPAFSPRPFERDGIRILPFVFATNALPALLGDRIVPSLLQLSWQPFTSGPRRLLQRSGSYDIVEFHFCAYASWMGRVASRARVVYSAHNVERDYALVESPSGLRRRLAAGIATLERRAVHASDLVVTCTETDGTRLAELYGELNRLAVVSNGYDEDEIQAMSSLGRERARAELGLGSEELAILFVGGPAAHNRRAVRFLQEQLLPAIQGPTRLVIAGRCVAPRREGRVLALGFVKRLHLLLAAADIAVNPVQAGSGSNLKLAEYVAAGLPVVTTPIGLRGYEAFRPRVIVAELDRFAEAVQSALPGRIRPLELSHLSWNALGRRLYDSYSELMAQRSRARLVG